MNSRRYRVVVVEDSAVTRQLLVALLNDSGDFEVVAAVGHGERAVERVAALRPDAVTMDLHLPGIDGIEATRRIMRLTPTPILVVSASANLHDLSVFQAIEAGAMATVQRPMAPGHPRYMQRRQRLLDELRAIAQVDLSAPGSAAQRAARVKSRRSQDIPPRPRRMPIEIIAIAASTGGPAALRRCLADLPASVVPPILIVQHIADGFSKGLAEWLQATTGRTVQLARNGQPVAPNELWLAPDDRHLEVSADRHLVLSRTPPVGGHRPSATVLFESVAETFGSAALGIVLTGMGRDGAEGLRKLREAGATTLAQDAASSVVYGMAGAAVDIGGVTASVPLSELGATIGRVLDGTIR